MVRSSRYSFNSIDAATWSAWAWPAIFALGAALRFWHIGAAQFWYDEAFTRWIAGLPFARLVAATAGDTHPPGYYALIWLWTKAFGYSELSVRLPSVLFSLWALYLARKLGERIGLSRPVVLAGSLLMALSPFQLHYSQEARQYALLQALVLLAWIAALDRRWLLFGAANAAALWTHNYGLFYLVPANLVAIYVLLVEWHNVYEWWNEAAKDSVLPLKAYFTALVRPWFVANVAALVSFAPWALVLRSQMTEIASNGWWVQPFTAGAPLHALYVWLWGFSLPEWAQGHGAILLFLLMGLAGWRLSERATRDGRPHGSEGRDGRPYGLVVLLAATPVVAGIFSVVWRPVWLHRALIGSAAPLYFLLAWAVVEGVRPARRAWAAALIVPMLVIGVVRYYPQVVSDKGDPRSAIAYIRSHWQDGDVVYHSNTNSEVIYRVYAPELPQFGLVPVGFTIGGYSEQTRTALGLHERPLDELEWKRAWLIWSEGPTLPAEEVAAVEAILARYHGVNVTTWQDTDLVRAGLWLMENDHVKTR